MGEGGVGIIFVVIYFTQTQNNNPAYET